MKCPYCGEELSEEHDLLDLMPDVYFVCPECGWVGEIYTIKESVKES